MRWVSTRVLPEPAPARISSGPSPCRTASRCGGFRPSSRSATRWSGRGGRRGLRTAPLQDRRGSGGRRAAGSAQVGPTTCAALPVAPRSCAMTCDRTAPVRGTLDGTAATLQARPWTHLDAFRGGAGISLCARRPPPSHPRRRPPTLRRLRPRERLAVAPVDARRGARAAVPDQRRARAARAARRCGPTRGSRLAARRHARRHGRPRLLRARLAGRDDGVVARQVARATWAASASGGWARRWPGARRGRARRGRSCAGCCTRRRTGRSCWTRTSATSASAWRGARRAAATRAR